MDNTVIKIENLSKLYRLGEVGTGTLSHDLNRFWARVRSKEDPFAKVGHVNDRTQKAEKGEHVWALKDINFEVKQGEVLGIIGKNGAGKSTLLKLLSRVTSPTTGTMKMKGRVASLLEVGTGFHPELTGRENIYMNGTIMGMNRHEIRTKLDDIVDFAGVAKYLDTPTKRYSSGMTVRLGFAIAAFLEPEILIVDEVLAVGDAEFQKRAIGKMQDISSGDGRTVLFVSHNMASVESLCNRALILKEGSILINGDTSEVINSYLNDQSEDSPDVDLTEYSRGPNLKPIVHRITIFDDQNKVNNSIKMGNDFSIKLILNQFNKLKNTNIGLIIKDMRGTWVTSFTTTMRMKKETKIDLESEYAILKINNLPLTAGDYLVDISISSPRVGRLDYVENAIKIHVESSDVYKNGMHVGNYFGYFFLDGEWVIYS